MCRGGLRLNRVVYEYRWRPPNAPDKSRHVARLFYKISFSARVAFKSVPDVLGRSVRCVFCSLTAFFTNRDGSFWQLNVNIIIVIFKYPHWPGESGGYVTENLNSLFININQLDALNFIISLFSSLYMFQAHVLIVRRAKIVLYQRLYNKMFALLMMSTCARNM